MYCPACGNPLQNGPKFCPACGAALAGAPRPSGPVDQLQHQLGSIPVVSMLQERLSSLPVPAVTVGAGGPPAAGPDLIWSAALALAALLSIWFMRWWLIPVFLGAGALALVYGLRPGVSLVTRSTLFLAAAAAGELALAAAGTFGGTGILGALVLMILAGRGIWGLLKEGRPGGAAFQLEGRRMTVLIIGLAICLVSLIFQWERDSSFAFMTLQRIGTVYTDGRGGVVRDSTWLSPKVNVSVTSGDNGAKVFPWLAGATILLLAFRNKAWPQWVSWVLTVCFTFMLLYGVQALGSMLGIGIILFCGGFGAIAWSLLSRRA